MSGGREREGQHAEGGAGRDAPAPEHGARSHVGRVRGKNEDAWFAEPAAGLYGVCDGMGGHAAGDVASAVAAEEICARLAPGAGDDPAPAAPTGADEGGAPADRLAGAIRSAGRRIREEARRDPARGGMGTTATALLLTGERWLVGHVGDSRAYLLREGELRQLTTDHTVLPGSSMLTRALGTEPPAEVDVETGELREEDLFLLATDGLTDDVSDERIRELLAEEGPGPEELAARLVDAALDRGGHDNVTALVVRLLSQGAQ